MEHERGFGNSHDHSTQGIDYSAHHQYAGGTVTVRQGAGDGRGDAPEKVLQGKAEGKDFAGPGMGLGDGGGEKPETGAHPEVHHGHEAARDDHHCGGEIPGNLFFGRVHEFNLGVFSYKVKCCFAGGISKSGAKLGNGNAQKDNRAGNQVWWA